jgi:hypothetical protein
LSPDSGGITDIPQPPSGAITSLSRSSSRIISENATGRVFARYVQTGVSTLPEITTTVAVHKTGNHMNLPISVKGIYGEDKKVAAVEATFNPSPDTT